jgi:magnesium transporter
MQTIYFSSARNRALEKLETPRHGAWISLVAPDERELVDFAEKYDLDIDLLTDATDIYEAPRVETHEGKVYIYTRYCYPEGQEIATEPMLIVYTQTNLLTISRLDTPIYKRLFDQGQDILTTQKTKTLLLILSEISLSYRLQLNRVYKQILHMRAQLRQSDISNRDFVRIIELEEDLNEFLAALQPQAVMLTALTNGKFIRLYEDDRDLIEDLMLSTNELTELTRSRMRTLTNLRQAYDAIATNNLNKIFKRLTSIAIFMAIPTILGGLWGMNVALPFQDDPRGFLYVVLITAGLIASAVYIFRRKDWL